MSNKTGWYKDAVIYQIYPRSFKDSDGDGVGDIRGIISELDYIKDLGVNAVWLSPCYKSPNDDNGYDISDYRGIMEEFGTLDDWKEMIEGMHSRGIRLLMDLVVNHTSDEHYWFKEAKKGADNPYHDYYIWNKGKDAPNKWQACFLGPAWEYVPELDESYLHLFSVRQPDLNWRNEKVRKEVEDICNYWLDLGVDGFRCDVITYIAKPENYKGSVPSSTFVCGEHWEEYIRELAANAWDKHDTFVVGEATGVDFDKACEITDERKGLLDSLFHFEHVNVDMLGGFFPVKFKLRKFQSVLNRWQSAHAHVWQSLYYENHDQPRSVPRFAPAGELRETSAKMLAVSLLFQRGTPFIYQGQEIGMTNCLFKEQDYKDIASINIMRLIDERMPFIRGYAMRALNRRARDNARTPMQWSAGRNAGFTDGEPWMMVNPNYVDINVDDNIARSDSVLSFYKEAIKVRAEHIDTVKNGNFTPLFPKSNKVFAFTRETESEKLLVLCNFKGKDVRVALPCDIDKGAVLLNNYRELSAEGRRVTLLPCQTAVIKLKYAIKNDIDQAEIPPLLTCFRRLWLSDK